MLAHLNLAVSLFIRFDFVVHASPVVFSYRSKQTSLPLDQSRQTEPPNVVLYLRLKVCVMLPCFFLSVEYWMIISKILE